MVYVCFRVLIFLRFFHQCTHNHTRKKAPENHKEKRNQLHLDYVDMYTFEMGRPVTVQFIWSLLQVAISFTSATSSSAFLFNSDNSKILKEDKQNKGVK